VFSSVKCRASGWNHRVANSLESWLCAPHDALIHNECFSFLFSRYRRSCGRSAVCHLIGHVHRVPHAQEGRRILRSGRTQTEFAQLTSIQQEQSWILRLKPTILFLTKIRRQQNEGFLLFFFTTCVQLSLISLTQTFFRISGWRLFTLIISRPPFFLFPQNKCLSKLLETNKPPFFSSH